MKRLLLFFVLLLNILAHAQSMPDSLRVRQAMLNQAPMNSTAIQKQPDSLSAVPSATGIIQAQKIRIIKKEIDFPTTIKLALGMMGFIGLMFFSTQSWNPSSQ